MIPKYSVGLLILTLFLWCKKYDEGPLFSLRSKYKRLPGSYEVEYLFVGGYDSTAAFKNQSCYGTLLFSSLSETLTEGVIRYFAFDRDSIYPCSSDGNGYLIDRKEKLALQRTVSADPNIHGVTPVGPFLIVGRVEWKIIKLTNKQLWLETTYGGNSSWVHLKKVSD